MTIPMEIDFKITQVTLPNAKLVFLNDPIVPAKIPAHLYSG